jgi:hypothetical protein
VLQIVRNHQHRSIRLKVENLFRSESDGGTDDAQVCRPGHTPSITEDAAARRDAPASDHLPVVATFTLP